MILTVKLTNKQSLYFIQYTKKSLQLCTLKRKSQWFIRKLHTFAFDNFYEEETKARHFHCYYLHHGALQLLNFGSRKGVVLRGDPSSSVADAL